MIDTLSITSAEAVVPGVLKLTWSDGYEGVADLRGIISKGGIFKPLRDPGYFSGVRVAAFGHSVYWGRDGDEDVDFGCDRLREMVEQQAELIARAS
ncbi:MAG: DUF2442 domain-containing protein [Rhizobiales bacterium]|jgi:hypothetical protein|nr:DUF2442 domain-containing protein [Hyphomicrobiales bacterium]OJU35245.1 MAG: hypothetical protein BGN94_24860 [Rhizobiales bacterium 68-8]